MVDTLSHPRPDEPTADPASTSVVLSDAIEEQRAWRRALAVGIGTFVVARIITIGGAYAAAVGRSMQRQQRGLPISRSARRLIEQEFLRWDGRWYKIIAEDGYQSDLPDKISYIPDNGGATVAFFPLYPYLARFFDHVFPGGIDQALLGVNVVLGLIGVVLVGYLAREAFDIETAERAMVLFSLFPGAVVISWSYSEPTLVVCAAACLLCLMRERWLLAGIFAALATATRPNGLALVAACAVAAALAIHRNRQWRSLISVVLAPLGSIAYFWYLRVHTDEPNAWMRAQRDAWNEGWSWGATAIRYMWRFAENPLATPPFGALYMHTTLAVVLFVFGMFCAVRKRIPWTWMAYAGGVGLLMLTPSVVSARPRFVWTAFPLAIAVAAWWPRKSRVTWDLAVVLSAGSLVVFTMLYAGYAMIP